MKPRAVFFDLGDTLIFRAHEPDYDLLYAAMADQLAPLLRSWNATERLDVAALLPELFRAIDAAQPGRRAKGYEVDGAFIARGALAAHGMDVAAEQAQAFWRGCAVDFALWGLQPYPDTLDTLRHVRALSLSAAIVCNGASTSDLVWRMLAPLGITSDLVDTLVSSSDMMRPKPRPEPFRRALDTICVDAADVIFVGDDLEADMRGAKALGMTTVWKLNGRHEVSPDPDVDYMVHDLWEIFTLGLLSDGPGPVATTESLTPHEDANADRY